MANNSTAAEVHMQSAGSTHWVVVVDEDGQETSSDWTTSEREARTAADSVREAVESEWVTVGDAMTMVAAEMANA